MEIKKSNSPIAEKGKGFVVSKSGKETQEIILSNAPKEKQTVFLLQGHLPDGDEPEKVDTAKGPRMPVTPYKDLSYNCYTSAEWRVKGSEVWHEIPVSTFHCAEHGCGKARHFAGLRARHYAAHMLQLMQWEDPNKFEVRVIHVYIPKHSDKKPVTFSSSIEGVQK